MGVLWPIPFTCPLRAIVGAVLSRALKPRSTRTSRRRNESRIAPLRSLRPCNRGPPLDHFDLASSHGVKKNRSLASLGMTCHFEYCMGLRPAHQDEKSPLPVIPSEARNLLLLGALRPRRKRKIEIRNPKPVSIESQRRLLPVSNFQL